MPAGPAPVRLEVEAAVEAATGWPEVDGIDPELGLELLPGRPSAVDRFWLIEINCSRLLTCTNWLMYSLGSVSAVGSWFCISVTSRVRKSLAEMVAEELPALAELLFALAAAGAAAMGFAPVPVSACPAVSD